MQKIKDAMSVLLAVALATPMVAAMLAAVFILKGFVISQLWLWFIVPVFGLVSLTIPQAIGMALVIAIVTKDSAPHKYTTQESIIGFFSPLVTLAIGYVLTFFMS